MLNIQDIDCPAYFLVIEVPWQEVIEVPWQEVIEVPWQEVWTAVYIFWSLSL